MDKQLSFKLLSDWDRSSTETESFFPSSLLEEIEVDNRIKLSEYENEVPSKIEIWQKSLKNSLKLKVPNEVSKISSKPTRKTTWIREILCGPSYFRPADSLSDTEKNGQRK